MSEIKFIGTSVVVAGIYLGVLYRSGFWRNHYISCLIIAFVIGFPLVFIPGIGFDQYDIVERVGFGAVCGVLLVQLSHVLITHVFEKG